MASIVRHFASVCVRALPIHEYRVAQNKPDYLLLLSKFCISTTNHVTTIMYV